MDNNFKVSVTAIFDKIDSSMLDKWQKQKKSIKIPIEITQIKKQNQLEIENRIKKIRELGGTVISQKIDVDTNKIKQATLEYRNQLGVVRELWEAKKREDGKGYESQLLLKSKTISEGQLKTEKELTREKEKQIKLLERYAKQTRQVQAKASSGKFVENPALSSAKISASRMQSVLGMVGSISPDRLEQYNRVLGNLSERLKIAQEGFVRVKKEQLSFGDSLKSKISTVLQYASASAVLFGALQQLQQGVQYIKDLNKAMTDIQLVTGMSAGNIENLTFKFSDFAKQMGVTTLDVAEGSLQFYRQGKSAEDTAELIKQSMMMSKLANIEAAESTEYLTSIMNGFQYEAEDMAGVLDKLVSIDNASASSVAELAEAMRRSSSVAQQSGVSFENLSAYIGTVSSVTRRSASTIGEAFKTIFVRMTEIREGALDEDGIGINKVEDALKRVDIQLRDSQGQFRDLDSIILELSTKWDRLDRLEKANISTAIAG